MDSAVLDLGRCSSGAGATSFCGLATPLAVAARPPAAPVWEDCEEAGVAAARSVAGFSVVEA